MSLTIEVNQASEVLTAVVIRAVEATFEQLGITDASVSVTLMTDPAITELNRRYLEHDEVTDVLSFPLYQEDETPLGDIYIGLEQAGRQARAAGVSAQEEIARLAIHGTLHVLGYDHPDDDRATSDMWQLQEKILRELRVD